MTRNIDKQKQSHTRAACVAVARSPLEALVLTITAIQFELCTDFSGCPNAVETLVTAPARPTEGSRAMSSATALEKALMLLSCTGMPACSITVKLKVCLTGQIPCRFHLCYAYLVQLCCSSALH